MSIASGVAQKTVSIFFTSLSASNENLGARHSLSLHLKVLAREESDEKYVDMLKRILQVLLEMGENEYIRKLYEQIV